MKAHGRSCKRKTISTPGDAGDITAKEYVVFQQAVNDGVEEGNCFVSNKFLTTTFSHLVLFHKIYQKSLIIHFEISILMTKGDVPSMLVKFKSTL